ncbi:MAG: hypothetical protein WB543_21240 [Candidatus Acidiferrum sp.]
MSIEKKSLISTLKTTKKANIAKEEFGQPGSISSGVKSPARVVAGRTVAGRTVAGRTVAGRTVAGRTVAGKTVAGKTVAGKTIAGRK